MKRFLKIIFLLVIINFNIPEIMAADFTTSISGSTGIASGGTITLTFKATSASNLIGLKATLNYDKDKLELVSSNGSNGFNLTVGTNIVVDSTDGKSGTFTYATLKFKAKANFKIGESTIVSITNVTGTSNMKTVSGGTSKITIKMKSTDNNLDDLKIDGKTITNFKSSTTNYKITVNNDVSTINITASPSSALATVKGTGTKKLNIYNNSFKIIVTAENGSTKTYTLNVIRLDKNGLSFAQSNNNTLKSLTIDGYELDFVSNVNEYSLSVNNEISKLNVTAIANDTKSKVEISNTDLVVGMNEITITVEAEDGSINKYVLKVKRTDDNPQITIDKFASISSTTTKETIEVMVLKDQVITKEQLEMIKNSNKNVIFSYYENDKLVYAWHILNSDILTDEEFITTLNFNNIYQNEIEKATNYAEAFYFSNDNPNKTKTKLKIFVGQDVLKTKLYYYDLKIKLQDDNIEVNDGYIEIAYQNNNYFISRTSIKNEINIWSIILGIENFLIAGFCIYIIVKRKYINGLGIRSNEKKS